MKDKKITSLRRGDRVKVRSLKSMIEGMGSDASLYSEAKIIKYCRDNIPKAFPPSMHKFIGKTAVVTSDYRGKVGVDTKVYLKFDDPYIESSGRTYDFAVAMLTPVGSKYDDGFKKAFWIKHLNGRVPGNMSAI